MPTTNAPAAPQTKSRKGGRLPSRLLLCGTAAMILLARLTFISGVVSFDLICAIVHERWQG